MKQNLKIFTEHMINLCTRARNPEEIHIVLPVKTLWAAVGPSAAIDIDNAYNGCDWDNGRVFIRPEFPVAVVDEEYNKAQSAARVQAEKLAFIYMHCRSTTMTPEQKIAAIKRTMKG